jgi:hypothetical protein
VLAGMAMSIASVETGEQYLAGICSAPEHGRVAGAIDVGVFDGGLCLANSPQAANAWGCVSAAEVFYVRAWRMACKGAARPVKKGFRSGTFQNKFRKSGFCRFWP